MNNDNIEQVTEAKTEDAFYELHELKLLVSRDNMTAYVRIPERKKDKQLTEQAVMQLLSNNNITYGINTQQIKEYCESKLYFNDLVAAHGKEPVPEKDGDIEYNIELNTKIKPKELENGNVDYYDLGIIQQVEKDQVLCTLIPPSGGVDGCNIYGNVVPFKKGRVPNFPKGTNTAKTEDGMHLIATVMGSVSCSVGAINVSEVYTVNGDVDNSTGNIEFSGSIIVKGDVRAGFKLKSGKDIAVKGIVEGAVIEAGGNVVISSGMNGMNSGSITAGGSVTGRFFENCKIESENEVTADSFINCTVKCGTKLIARKNLMSGNYTSGKVILAKEVGNDSHPEVRLTIDSPELRSALWSHKNSGVDDMQQKLSKMKAELAEFEEKYEAVKANNSLDRSTIYKLLQKKSQLQDAVKMCQVEIENNEKKSSALSEFKIVVRTSVFSGARLMIGPYYYNVDTRTDHSKFIINSEGIQFAPLNASDMS